MSRWWVRSLANGGYPQWWVPPPQSCMHAHISPGLVTHRCPARRGRPAVQRHAGRQRAADGQLSAASRAWATAIPAWVVASRGLLTWRRGAAAASAALTWAATIRSNLASVVSRGASRWCCASSLIRTRGCAAIAGKGWGAALARCWTLSRSTEPFNEWWLVYSGGLWPQGTS